DQLVGVPDAPNAFSVMTWKHGDVEEGFKQADIIVENTFRTPSRHTGYIEPHAGSVFVDSDGRIQVYMATKSPFGTRTQLAAVRSVPEHQIKINPVNVGGDFGGKGDAMALPIAYFLAKQTGRPVLVLMNYLEELQAGNPSHPSVVTIKTGVMKDGRMV